MTVSTETPLPPRAALPRPTLARQMAAFLAVGGSSALAFALLSTAAIGLRTGAPDWLVSAICYAAMIVPTYFAHARLSFRSTAPHRRALPRYALVQAGAVGLAALFGSFIYAIPGLPTLLAALLVAGLVAAASFVALRLWAFVAPRPGAEA